MTENNEKKQEVEKADKVEKATDTATDTENREHEVDVITEAKKIQENMKAENDRKQKLLEREEKLQARKEALQALGGGSRAGSMPEKPAEPTAKEYAESVLAGKFNKK